MEGGDDVDSCVEQKEPNTIATRLAGLDGLELLDELENFSLIRRSRKVEAIMLLSLLAHLLSGYFLLTNPSHLTRAALPPEPLVLNTSYLDILDGDLETAYDEFLRNEITVILYYASWDAKSEEKLHMLNELGHEMPDVKFVAINCWQNSACLKYYDSRMFPTLFIYVRGIGSIQNLAGRLQKDYISTLIYNAINPISVIKTKGDWFALRSRHLVVVTIPVTYFKFGYALAIECLRSDPQQRIGFGIYWTSDSKIRLHTWNSESVYNESDNPTVSAVSKWIFANAEQPLYYLMNTGFKSLQIERIMNGSTAVAFIKASKDSELDNFLHLLALQIYSCPGDYENNRELFQALFLKPVLRPVHCGNLPPVIECRSTSKSCLPKPENRSSAGWPQATQTCFISEGNRLRRVDLERFCGTIFSRRSIDYAPDVGIAGAACGRHDSFKIVLLDSSAFEEYHPLEAPLVIYDSLVDIKYILPKEKFNPVGIEQFIGDYLKGFHNKLEKSANMIRREQTRRPAEIFVPPVSSRNDSVIFYYTNWCGFCKSVTATFLRVSRFFRFAPITFERIDAEGVRFTKVQYSPDSFPQIVFYPKDSNDSVRFEGDWTPQALTRFILHNCHEDVLQRL